MARYMDEDNEVVFRSVITTRRIGNDGQVYEHTKVHGPFARKNTATGVITRESRIQDYSWNKGNVFVTGYVEKSSTKWEKVED